MVKFAKLNIALGIIVGLAYLIKITGLVLIPIWFLMTLTLAKILLKSLPDRGLFLVKCLGLFLVGFLVTAGWYWREITCYMAVYWRRSGDKAFWPADNAVGNVRTDKLLDWFFVNKL